MINTIKRKNSTGIGAFNHRIIIRQFVVRIPEEVIKMKISIHTRAIIFLNKNKEPLHFVFLPSFFSPPIHETIMSLILLYELSKKLRKRGKL